jgi:hypothetical protein
MCRRVTVFTDTLGSRTGQNGGSSLGFAYTHTPIKKIKKINIKHSKKRKKAIPTTTKKKKISKKKKKEKKKSDTNRRNKKEKKKKKK